MLVKGTEDSLLVAEMPARQRLLAGGKTELRILAGTANPELAREVAEYMGLTVSPIKISPFSDGEIYVQVQESVRGLIVSSSNRHALPSMKT